jgi:hypothetical protein
MDKKDILECLSLLKVAYPYIYRDISDGDAKALVNLWSFSFADSDPQTVKFAVSELIKRSSYAPSIADIRGYISSMEDIASGTPSDSQMWSILLRAVRNGYYNFREEFEKLPDELKAYVGQPEQLRAWAQIDESIFNSVHQSNFMKNFKASRQRVKDSKLLSPEVKQLLLAQKKRMSMPGDRLLPDENERRNAVLDALEAGK